MSNLETQLERRSPLKRERVGEPVSWDAPVLHGRQGGLAERTAGALGSLHPVLVFLVVVVVGLAVIAALSIALGFFITRVIEPAWGIGAADERVNVWLTARRTLARTHASLIGSIVAGGVVLPILVGSIALVCVVLKKWRIAAFVVFALAVESATYRATTLVVHSHRPRVPRLEKLPVNASYPSGHTAASLAVYVAAMVVFVATSRMYRGMHHPLDVAGGLLVGAAALVVVVFACRTAGAAAEARAGGRS
jgi:undecaprenyl-diphosphatase